MSQATQRSLCDSLEAMEQAFGLAADKLEGVPLNGAVLLRKLLMVAAALDMTFDLEVRRHAGIGKTEFRTLMLLLSSDGCAAPSELSNADHLGRANMTRVADVLIGHGYASRTMDAADRRRIALCITAKGRKLVERVAPKLAARETVVFEGVSSSRKREFADVLQRIAANLDAWNGKNG
jgi:DNA-binding MarR family transcriptional regulator